MKKKNKKTWRKIEVTKIKLNPEQAVLSCCEIPTRGERGGAPCFPQCITVGGAPCGSEHVNSDS